MKGWLRAGEAAFHSAELTMHIPAQRKLLLPHLDSAGSHLDTCSHLPLNSRDIPQCYTNIMWSLTNNIFSLQCPHCSDVGLLLLWETQLLKSLDFKQGKTRNYQVSLQACLKNKTLRSKWPNSQSPDIPYRKLKHQVLQSTSVVVAAAKTSTVSM